MANTLKKRPRTPSMMKVLRGLQAAKLDPSPELHLPTKNSGGCGVSLQHANIEINLTDPL